MKLCCPLFLSVTSIYATEVTSKSSNVQQACSSIKTASSQKLFYPQDNAYGLENTDYYNIGLAELKPACIFQPTTAEEVSAAVKILNNFRDVPFAVKSGGHDPNPGHSSVKDGVLIALSKMDFVHYDKSLRTAQFGPGGHWNTLLTPLDKQGVTVVGGRLGIVGVGGYMMQGGLSFLSSQYGMAADSILEYEMVLPNGTIMNINYEKHPELVVAMRGSGDQFGIATKFTTRTYPMGKVWGGIRIYLGNAKKALYAALYDFVKAQKDPKAAIIFTHDQPLGLMSVYMLFFFYDGPEVPPGAFGKFLDISPAIDLCKTRTYIDMLDVTSIGGASDGASSLLGGLGPVLKGSSRKADDLDGLTSDAMQYLHDITSGNEDNTASKFHVGYSIDRMDPPLSTTTTPPRSAAMGSRTSFRSVTMPLLDQNWFSEIESIWTNVMSSFSLRHPTVTGTIAIQPFGPLIGAQSESRGGNAMGLRGDDPPRFIIEIAFLWSNKTLDEDVARLSKTFAEKVQAKAKTKMMSTNVANYLPYFMNDAAKDQDVTSSYKDATKFAQLQKAIDPQGLFKRTGSFKYL